MFDVGKGREDEGRVYQKWWKRPDERGDLVVNNSSRTPGSTRYEMSYSCLADVDEQTYTDNFTGVTPSISLFI